MPRSEARIASAEYTPPERCPTPSVFVPQFGGVSYSIVPAGGTESSLRPQSRFATTLTISYSMPLNPRARVFACTSMGCTDITNLASIDVSRNSVSVRIEDGGVLDGDGQVNGQIKTKNFVYAVIPEDYRKGGGCAMGGGAFTDALLWMLLFPLVLARRLRALRPSA
ncbi:MAG: hypothetical protein N3C13_00205 [Aquificaceae bacterium]|nr:hypothetical protein [Aquificaceae bacterium]